MNIVLDIGGTNFRTSYKNYYNKIRHNLNSKKSLFDLIEKEVLKVIKKYEINNINNIIIALPGIVSDYRLYECCNLNFLNFTDLPKNILNLNCQYINDGDLSLIGEMKYNNINEKRNILSLIVGTGVGVGIWCNNNILYNCEVVSLFEPYLGGINFDDGQIFKIKDKFINDLSYITELLNLDIIIINGFINNYDQLIIDKNQLNIRNFYKDKLEIIYSECKEPVLYGGSILLNK
jgi:hypothetical protein